MSELYALPDGWKWKNINAIIQKTKNKVPKNEPNREFTYIDISSIDNSLFSIVSPKRLKSNEAPSRAKKEIMRNDIIFATTRPNLKNIAIIKDEYDNPIASTGFCILRVNEKSEFQYLFFYLLSSIFYKQVEKSIRGSQYPAISDKDVKSIDIPLPPLQEQKRIVAKLDNLFSKIDQAIALHQKNINEIEGFMGSVLNKIFKELEAKYGTIKFSKTIDNNIQNGLYKHKDFYNNDGIYILRIDNFYNGRINKFGIKRLSLTNDETNKYRLYENDIIINRVNSIEYLGKCAIVPKQIEPMVFESNMMRISVLKENDPSYIVHTLQSENIKNQISKKAKRAVNQCSINQTDVNTLTFPLPPLNIQQKTVTYLDAILKKTEAIKTIQKEKMQNLKDLKASILDRAFRGEL